MSIINKITGLIGIVCFTVVAFEGIRVMKQNKSTIKVYGLADYIVTSDRARMVVEFTENGNDINEINEILNKNQKVIYDFLKKQGIDENEIQENSVEIEDNYYRYYSDKSGKIPDIRYKVTKTLTIDTDKIDIVKDLQSKTTKLLESNIFVTTSTSYSYSKFDDLKLKLIEDATKDAISRAKHISKVTNCKLKKLRNLSTGKFSILDGNSSTLDRDWSDGENTYKKRYRVIVNVTYDKE
ncbi:MAG: SIMPL domain-containing protein [Alphaproteobacteria bacterium]|nr:SIMPL domain-containing protein [Alphaproteobacteria bacterium]